MLTRMLTLFLLVLLAGCTTQAPHPDVVEQVWAGQASAGPERTRVLISLKESAGKLSAEMTLPDVGVSGWPASGVRRTERQLFLEFPSDSGTQTMVLARRNATLTGSWSEPGRPDAALISLARIQDAGPRREERVTIPGPAGAIGASVILPAAGGPYPGVVMLHGSGAQPRDANRFAAEALARRGIAVVIFDKRGVGESEGELAGASFEDLASDAIAVARHLDARDDISGVGFFGHSQGGWLAPLAAVRWGNAAFVITSAGPAVPPSREAHWDIVRSLRVAGAGARSEQRARDTIDLWHTGIRTSDWRPFDSALEGLRGEPWFEQSGIQAFAERPETSFARAYSAFMDYDPLPVLRALQIPMLAILAPEDESMDALETGQILAELIAEGRDVRIKLYPGYDHAMRRLGSNGAPPRWPNQPPDYYDLQANFILGAAGLPK